MAYMGGQLGFRLDRPLIVLRYPGLYVDQLDVIYTRLDRSFIVPSELLS